MGCGSRGGTCSKRVVFSINLGDETKENSVELVRGKAVQEKKVNNTWTNLVLIELRLINKR